MLSGISSLPIKRMTGLRLKKIFMKASVRMFVQQPDNLRKEEMCLRVLPQLFALHNGEAFSDLIF